MYCQILDCLYPGTFQLAKVKWNAKHEYEFVENYKVLQNAFDKNGIKRHIEVGKLCKARYQDNLEFCQWMKAYFEKNHNGEPYDALGRRKNQELHYILGGGKVGPPVAAKKSDASAPVPKAAPASYKPPGGISAGSGGMGAKTIGGASGAQVK